jgi:2-C-methyl-D-erythritol 4-phosphate cytidylyltransferase
VSRREAVVLVAAGVGRRLGPHADGPKALVSVAGRTLLDLALTGLRDAAVQDVIVVHTPGVARAFEDTCQRHGVLRLVPGGDRRTDSVRAGVAAVPDDVPVVAIHDAARALTPGRVIRAVLDAVSGDVVAAAPAQPVADTLKRADDGRVLGTVDRSGLFAVHTPQAFDAEVLRAALAHGADATDDLALVERAIADGVVAGRIRLVSGSPWDLKITYPEDLEVAEALLASRRRGARP